MRGSNIGTCIVKQLERGSSNLAARQEHGEVEPENIFRTIPQDRPQSQPFQRECATSKSARRMVTAKLYDLSSLAE